MRREELLRRLSEVLADSSGGFPIGFFLLVQWFHQLINQVVHQVVTRL